METYFDAHFAEILWGALTTAISVLFAALIRSKNAEIKTLKANHADTVMYLRRELDECQDRDNSHHP